MPPAENQRRRISVAVRSRNITRNQHRITISQRNMTANGATGTSLDIPSVAQDPAMAAQIRKNLEHVKLPPGFKIDLFAIVPDARHMAVSKSIGVVYTGTRKSQAGTVTDRDRDRIADEVKVLAPSIAMKVPDFNAGRGAYGHSKRYDPFF